MLIDEPPILSGPNDAGTRAILAIISDGVGTKHLQTGVYLIDGFNGHLLLPSGQYNEWVQFGDWRKDDHCHGSYGVCDGVEDIMRVYAKWLDDPLRKFVITLTEVKRDLSNKGNGGGWRWHKWGEYIGSQTPTMKHLDDEPLIERVFCFHIYEKK